MRGFINYANDNPNDLTKDEQMIIADLSNQSDVLELVKLVK